MTKYNRIGELCVMCGRMVPEGMMVCPLCVQEITEKSIEHQKKKEPKKQK